MLVLSRQRDESVVLDFSGCTAEDLAKLTSGAAIVEIAIVDIRGDKVRTGFTAPQSVQVHRMEVWRTIRREAERLAAAGAPKSEDRP